MTLNIKAFCLGPLQNNSYVFWDDQNKEAFAVDPPLGSELMAAFIKHNGLNLTKILNTHCHFDHIGGNALLARFFGAKLFVSRKDLELLLKGAASAGCFGLEIESSPAPDGFLKEGDVLGLGETEVRVIETPGHTPGGLCFHAGPILFSGDSLFAGSIGRTDLDGGDFEALAGSIREKLFILPPETKVYPGHGPFTTIGAEIGANPFVGASAGMAGTGADND